MFFARAIEYSHNPRSNTRNDSYASCANHLGSAVILKDMLKKADPRDHVHGEHEMVVGLGRTTRMYELTAALVRRGYTDEQVRLVLGGNWARVLKDIWHAEG